MIMLVGNSLVCKSSLIIRFIEKKIASSYIATILVDFRLSTIEIDESTIKMKNWVIVGNEWYKTMTNLN